MALWALLLLQAAAPAGTTLPVDYMAEAAKRFEPAGRCEPPPSSDSIDGEEQLLVCGRRSASDRFRLLPARDGFDPSGPIDSVSRERHKLIQEGDAGVGSCSTVGAGGWTGCFHRDVKRRCQQDPCGIAF